MIDIRTIRLIAKELLVGLDARTLDEEGQCPPFLEEQKGILRRALNESATPERYRVAVVGSFKVGKSSFVNAICGQRVLTPVDSNPETAAITILKFAKSPSASAHMIREDEWQEMKTIWEENPDDIRAARYRKIKDLTSLDQEGPRIEDLERDLISADGVIETMPCEDWEGKEQRKIFNGWIKKRVSRRDPLHFFVDHLVICAPIPILKDGIDLIDTPGLDDTDRYRVDITEELVKDVDAILFLTRSGSSYSQSDKEFIVRQLRRKTLKHLRIVITKCDETFANASDDAEARDEEKPTYEAHLKGEEERIRAELRKTLDEILAERDVDELGREYFTQQLAQIHIDFVSSKYHFSERCTLSGIDRLRDELNVMLQKNERVVRARNTLIGAISRVTGRTIQVLKTRIGAVSKDFSAERVRQQIAQFSSRVRSPLSRFERRIKKEVVTLKEECEKDEEFVEAKIESILLRCDSTVDTYAREDVGKHWKTRRCSRWGSLHQIQQQIADNTFPNVELLIQRQVKRFEDTTRRMQRHAALLQQALGAVEEDTHLDVALDPLPLSETFGSAIQTFVSEVGQLVGEQRDCIVRHLDTFVSEEVRHRIDDAQIRVSNIKGKGTTWRQNSEVEEFYSELKTSLRQSMAEHLGSRVNRFTQMLLKRADSIYPKIKQEMSILLDDRLNAIRINLSELNEAQKAEKIRALRHGVRCCERARKALQHSGSPVSSENDHGNGALVLAAVAAD
jgi:predicted GTPase